MRAPEQLGPYLYRQSDACFPLGEDTLRLAAFASVRRGDRVCDLGCGAGALLLLLLAAGRRADLGGHRVELDPADAALARGTWRKTAWQGRSSPATSGASAPSPPGAFPGGVQPALLRPGRGASGGRARTEEAAAWTGWCAAAGRLLKNGGRFALVHRPERLADLFAALRGPGLEPKRLQLVQHGPDTPPSAALVEAVRQGRPGLAVLPALLMHTREVIDSWPDTFTIWSPPPSATWGTSPGGWRTPWRRWTSSPPRTPG